MPPQKSNNKHTKKKEPIAQHEVRNKCTDKRQQSRDTDSDSEDGEGENLSKVMGRLSKRFSGESKNIARMLETFELMCAEFNTLKKRINGIVKTNQMLKNEVRELRQNEEKVDQRIQQLERFATKNKQNNNKNNMVITNLPKFADDTNLKRVVMKIGEQIEHQIAENEIIDIYQTENKLFKTYPVIVKLNSDSFKNKCMEFRKSSKKIDIKQISNNLNNSDKNINFHHMIEKEYSILLKKTKEVTKNTGHKFVWFGVDCVLVRKEENAPIIKIKNERDLDILKK